ncbi:MAG: hypothetical protein CVU59_11150 [Deltaproteobacteria bacterium HGW-Deltaproteobacteria-17]|nr:MAG: hypothetical protein CVU59_11150 [Deltaproteobacteria bacterium HGW-Deltaproteobacteria-17]
MKYILLACHLSLLVLAGCMDVKAVAPDPACGDYLINQEGEECDSWDTGSHTCQTLGFHDGVLACTATCTLDFSDCERFGSCGDGIVQTGAGEECDEADLHEASCLSLGYHGGTLACTADCHYDVASCEDFGTCGDGIVQEDFEECDLDGFAPGFDTCGAQGYYGGTVACMANCRADLSNCRTSGTCGDGMIQSAAGEECDTNNLGDASCHGLGFYAGHLACADCGFDTSDCINPVSIASGTTHTCAVLDDGSAWCWGRGSEGQLGNDQTSEEEYNEYSPVQVQVPAGVMFTQIAAGTNHTCALDSLHRAWCWGLDFGMLGTNSPQPGVIPVPVAVAMPAGRQFAKLSLGLFHACALDTTGAVWCWGYNTAGQLGLGDLVERGVAQPTQAATSIGEPVVDLDCGLVHTCAVTATGGLYCWGADNSGQIALDPEDVLFQDCNYWPFEEFDGTIIPGPCMPVPSLISGIGYARRVSGGGMLLSSSESGGMSSDLVVRSHTCAITTADLAGGTNDDFVVCFGANDSGQLGNGTQDATSVPQLVQMPFNIATFDTVTTGFQHSCVTGRGVGWCWGLNLFGQLANGRADNLATTPTMVQKPLGVNLSTISAGFAHNCALSEGRVWCWGFGMDGEVGMGSSDIVPTLVEVRIPE